MIMPGYYDVFTGVLSQWVQGHGPEALAQTFYGRAAGYGVATLWAAEGGAQEGDRLGLAVIENRRRP